MASLPVVEIECQGIANGGDGVGREPSGRVVFASGALPGERVRVQLSRSKRTFARGEVVEVLDRSPDRVEPGCPVHHAGCGGCGLLYASHGAQLRAKEQIVADVFERIAHLEVPDLRHGPALPTAGFRTTARVAVSGGVAAFRRRRSHDLVAVPTCDVAHPLLAELLTADFGSASAARIRVGANTGERMVVFDELVDGVEMPSDVRVVHRTDAGEGDVGDRVLHEVVGGHRFGISAGSFFQSRTDGAEQLVHVVGEMVTRDREVGVLVDLCAGVGLFGVAIPATSLVSVEVDAGAHRDAVRNVAGIDQPTECVHADVATWRPSAADTVIVDPPRDGLGSDGVATVSGTGAEVVVLVSCDAGAGARDAGLLAAAGYDCDDAVIVDMFPHTARIELVTRWVRR